MLVGIVAANNLRYSPYVYFYTDIFEKNNIQYEVILPDRNNLKEQNNHTIHELTWDNKKTTLINYVQYAINVKRIIKEKHYDIIIVLTGINAAFLGRWLKKYYKRKYIVDIRDYSHENILPFYLLEKTAINNSGLNVISSRRFTDFLPKSEYYVCHNYNGYDEIIQRFDKGKEPLRIGYVGGLAYLEQCTKLMKLVASDPRFVFDFYGTSDIETTLKEIADEFKCDRIVFHGAYTPTEKAMILKKIDILFNAYGNGCPLLDCALSNKLYDALIFLKPILTCKNTYMTEMAGPLAFPIDLTNENALNDLYEWYQDIDGMQVEEFAKHKLEIIERENNETKEKIVDSILK